MFRTEHLGTLGDFVSRHLKLIPHTPMILYINIHCFPGGSVIKNPPALREMWVRSLGLDDPWRRKWQPTPVLVTEHTCKYSCLGNLMDRGAWQATPHGVAKDLDTT